MKIDKETNSATCEMFSDLYPQLVKHIVKEGDFVPSRNGNTIELLNFKTIINKPEHNLVGGYGRNINVFFLFAEAIWIWLGKKDVKFLNFFNSNMKNFSDDGEVFHAPYGFRLRHCGLHSNDDKEQGLGVDQIKKAIKMLSENHEDRRVVMSIWNPELDLGIKSKDLPCNSMLMLKVRRGELHLTVQNRSNDLHWGLPTNVFQFSFIGFLLSQILGVKQGTQVHNSQSLHIYLNSEITLQMLNKYEKESEESTKNNSLFKRFSIYEEKRIELKKNILFEENFSSEQKLKSIDYILKLIYDTIETIIDDGIIGGDYSIELKEVKTFSEYLFVIFKGLIIYSEYALSERGDEEKKQAMFELESNDLNLISISYNDFAEKRLMKNFFLTRLNHEKCEYL